MDPRTPPLRSVRIARLLMDVPDTLLIILYAVPRRRRFRYSLEIYSRADLLFSDMVPCVIRFSGHITLCLLTHRIKFYNSNIAVDVHFRRQYTRPNGGYQAVHIMILALAVFLHCYLCRGPNTDALQPTGDRAPGSMPGRATASAGC